MAEEATQDTDKVVRVPIVKGKGHLDVNIPDIPDDVWREVILQGLKVVLNRGTSKITKTTYPNEDELKAAAMAKAQEQLELVKTSKIKFTGGKQKKATGAIMVEARRIARAIIKDEMKKAGIKVSHVAASEITKAANELIDQKPEIIKQAEENLKARATPNVTEGIDIGAMIKVDPELKAKAEAKAAKAKAEKPLSAKQAGKAAPRGKKGKGAATQAQA